jgi:hypothetical protein
MQVMMLHGCRMCLLVLDLAAAKKAGKREEHQGAEVAGKQLGVGTLPQQ